MKNVLGPPSSGEPHLCAAIVNLNFSMARNALRGVLCHGASKCLAVSFELVNLFLHGLSNVVEFGFFFVQCHALSEDVIPRTIGQLRKLCILSLRGNQLKGESPHKRKG